MESVVVPGQLTRELTHEDDCLNGASIFVSTYNCGGCSPGELELPEMLQFWIPQGHDLYVIGVRTSLPP